MSGTLYNITRHHILVNWPFGNLNQANSAWMNNHKRSKVWDEITYPFPNFQQLQHLSLEMDR